MRLVSGTAIRMCCAMKYFQYFLCFLSVPSAFPFHLRCSDLTYDLVELSGLRGERAFWYIPLVFLFEQNPVFKTKALSRGAQDM